jgi:hypothetical protein
MQHMPTKRFEAVFVVRLWREASSASVGAWRGAVTAASGERFYFTELSDLCEFLERGMPAAGYERSLDDPSLRSS